MNLKETRHLFSCLNTYCLNTCSGVSTPVTFVSHRSSAGPGRWPRTCDAPRTAVTLNRRG